MKSTSQKYEEAVQRSIASLVKLGKKHKVALMEIMGKLVTTSLESAKIILGIKKDDCRFDEQIGGFIHG